MAARQLDFSAIWSDVTALMASNREIALALAGVFFLLPILALQFLVTPIEPILEPTPEQAFQMLQDWFVANWYWFILIFVVGMIGSLSFNIALLDGNKPTVGQALQGSLRLLPTLFLTRLTVAIIVMLGFFLLIVPGIYLFVKLLVVEPVIAAENQTNPITALQRSWELTRGNSLRIFGFLLIAAIVSIIAFFVISLILSIIITLLLPLGVAIILTGVVSAVLQVGLSLLFLFTYAAIYRQLTAA